MVTRGRGEGPRRDDTPRVTPPTPASSPPEGEHPSRELLVASVEAAVAEMSWLQASDRAAVDLALAYAARIDEALEHGSGQDVTKALYLGPHLLNALRALGGTPAERKALAVEEAVGGKLAQLRSVAGAS